MDEIKIELDNETIKSNKIIATTKNEQQNNILEQFIVGNWNLEELITAKTNFKQLINKHIYQTLSEQEKSILDNIRKKQKEIEKEFISNLTTKEKKLYHQLDNFSLDQQDQINNLEQKNSRHQSKEQHNKDNVVSLDKYRDNN